MMGLKVYSQDTFILFLVEVCWPAPLRTPKTGAQNSYTFPGMGPLSLEPGILAKALDSLHLIQEGIACL